MANGDIQFIFNTPSGKGARTDEGRIRAASVAYGVPCVTTLPGCIAVVEALDALQKQPERQVRSLQEWARRDSPKTPDAARLSPDFSAGGLSPGRPMRHHCGSFHRPEPSREAPSAESAGSNDTLRSKTGTAVRRSMSAKIRSAETSPFRPDAGGPLPLRATTRNLEKMRTVRE